MDKITFSINTMNNIQKQISYHIKLGVFIAVGIALLLLTVFFIGQARNLFSKTYSLSTIFRDVNGLQVGNNVWLAGIHVGTIESVTMISDSSVMVDMNLKENTRQFISKSARASIGSDGLMGNKLLIITPGKNQSTQVEDNDMLASTPPINMDDIMKKFTATAENANQITGDMAAITRNIRRGKGTIGKLFMDTTFAENLDKSLVNVKEGTKGFKDNMDAAKNSFLLKRAFKKDKKK
jgi:phospholipid/cholesterol/gamma-HCH transport system substrate-binding protein